jgi:uncharacterized protein (DUF1697 family)
MLHVALLRGVNVGGANRLPMADFRAMLVDMGLRDAKTYIQSGNAVFHSDLPADVLSTRIRAAIATRYGFAPDVFMLDQDDMDAALTDHPFEDAAPEKVHVFFLTTPPPALDDAAMHGFAAPGDGWHLRANRFHLHTPAGIGRSKLADRLHRFIPGQMTARNLRTIKALSDLAR